MRSFTGDFAIGAVVDESYGLFGNELPIVEEYETIPPLPDYAEASKILDQISQIASYAPIVSGGSLLRIGSFSIKAPIFGVDPSSYFRVCANVQVEGDVGALRSGGVLLSDSIANAAAKAIKRSLKVGEPITFSTAVSGTFRVRRGFFAGIVRYPTPNPALDLVVLTDPMIVRGLSDYTLGGETVAAMDNAPEDADTDIESLFEDAADTTDQTTMEGVSLEEIRGKFIVRDTDRDLVSAQDCGAWSFILVRTVPGTPIRALRQNVARLLAAHTDGYRVLDWKTAAGSSVSALFMLRIAFYVGIGFLVFGAALIVMNALVLSVMERTGEIGSLRALGASRGFIRIMFISETLLLTVSAASLGVIIGALAVVFASKKGIPLSNPLLVSLFGGSLLRPRTDIVSAIAHLLGAVLVAALAWIYPVSLALKISPMEAMREAE